MISNTEKQSNNSMPASNSAPTLFYPCIRGSIQPIRNLLYCLNVRFIQNFDIDTKQLDAGFNSGYPKLEHEDVVIVDTIAIFRHLCRRYQRQDILGLTPQNKATINEFLFHFQDILNKVIKKISEGARSLWTSEGNTIAYDQKLGIVRQILQNDCGIIRSLLQMYLKSKGWLFGYLTIADFFFYEICFYLTGFFQSVLVNHPFFRGFSTYKTFFEQQNFYKENSAYIESKKIFLPFKDQTTQEIMKMYWEGNKDLVS